MKPGSVVITSVLQSDGKQKSRPALLLKEIPPFGDWLLCPISSQLQHYLPGIDVKVTEDSVDFRSMHLLKPSIVRVCKLQAVPTSFIKGEIGEMSPATFGTLIQQLKDWL